MNRVSMWNFLNDTVFQNLGYTGLRSMPFNKFPTGIEGYVNV